MVTGQRIGPVRSRNQRSPSTACPEAGQRPAAPRGAAPAPLGQQQPGDELGQFPRDVERGTIGDHVEPSGEDDLVVRPLLPGLHAYFRACPTRPRVCLDARRAASPAVRTYFAEITSLPQNACSHQPERPLGVGRHCRDRNRRRASTSRIPKAAFATYSDTASIEISSGIAGSRLVLAWLWVRW